VIDQVLRLAECGDREAMFLYGSALEVLSKELRRKELDPMEWYYQAANLGSAVAMHALAELYKSFASLGC